MFTRSSVRVVGLLLLMNFGIAFASERPAAGDFRGCPAVGDGGDADLNNLKNRSSQVDQPEPMSVGAVVALAAPAGVDKQNRAGWPRDALAQVAAHERTGVVVEGFVVAVKQEGLESVNCRRTDLHDYHAWLAASPRTSKAQAFVAEVTPRWRAANSGWRLQTLRKLVSQGARFRLTGWLLFDQEHPEQIGQFRATLWEIHPITRIEVFTGGKWVEL